MAMAPRRWLEILAAIVTIMSVCSVVALHFGAADYFLDLAPAIEVAQHYDKSYSVEDGPYMLHPDSSSWPIMMRLIGWYSIARIDEARAQTIGRAPAIAAGEIPVGSATAEWTAPGTPILVLYGRVDNGSTVGPNDAVVVGSIQDLHDWIQRARDDFRFWVTDVAIGSVSAVLAVLLLWREN
jgi:hypothetical protein